MDPTKLGWPGRARTDDPQINSLLLIPTELLANKLILLYHILLQYYSFEILLVRILLQ